ncbi:MAG: amidohydrolase family protein, partial [Leeuwenhoekiella sp.]
RHNLQAESADFMLKPEFLNGISKLKKYNLTYDIVIHAEQLESALKMVKMFPEQSFVLDHAAKPNISENRIELWKTNLKKLADCQNVYCKVSGLVTEANWNTWVFADFKPILEVIFEVFGVKRLLFGSDWPVCLLAADYDQVTSIIANYTNSKSVAEKQGLWKDNTANFYNISS